MLLPFRTLLSIASGLQGSFGKQLGLALKLLRFFGGDLGAVFGGEGAQGIGDDAGVAGGFIGGALERFGVFDLVGVELFEFGQLLAAELGEFFTKQLCFGGIKLIGGIARGFLQGIPEFFGLCFDLLEFFLGAGQGVVGFVFGLVGVFVFAGVAFGFAHLIEVFAQLAGLFIEALGFLREAALAFGPGALLWIDGLLKNDDAHGR